MKPAPFAFQPSPRHQPAARRGVLVLPPFSAKKSPGTDPLSNQEELFAAEAAQRLYEAGKSRLENVDPGVIDLIKEAWEVSDGDLQPILEHTSEPVTFRERTLALLKENRVCFMVDDLSDSRMLENIAFENYGVSLNQEDEYLYPRFDAYQEPPGHPSVFDLWFVDQEAETTSSLSTSSAPSLKMPIPFSLRNCAGVIHSLSWCI